MISCWRFLPLWLEGFPNNPYNAAQTTAALMSTRTIMAAVADVTLVLCFSTKGVAAVIVDAIRAIALKIPVDERYRDLATVDHESSGAGGAGSRATRWVLRKGC